MKRYEICNLAQSCFDQWYFIQFGCLDTNQVVLHLDIKIFILVSSFGVRFFYLIYNGISWSIHTMKIIIWSNISLIEGTGLQELPWSGGTWHNVETHNALYKHVALTSRGQNAEWSNGTLSIKTVKMSLQKYMIEIKILRSTVHYLVLVYFLFCQDISCGLAEWMKSMEKVRHQNVMVEFNFTSCISLNY